MSAFFDISPTLEAAADHAMALVASRLAEIEASALRWLLRRRS